MSIDQNRRANNHATNVTFDERMLDILNDGALALMISIGHKTRLFDHLATLPPSTSEQIARATGLNERYIREWLAAMVTGRILTYDAHNDTYSLPTEHAAFLTRNAGPNNLASQMQYIVLLAGVQDEVVNCFIKGGGVPYSSFPTFQQVMAEESGQIIDGSLLSTTLPLVPGLVERLNRGIDVADFGCGSGHAINVMARAFPKSRFTGYDISEEGIAVARAEAQLLQLSNAQFKVQDIAHLNVPASYDCITAFDAIHDQAYPAQVLKNIATALRPHGTFLMVDIAGQSHHQDNMNHPLAPFLYTISCNHCMTVSLAANGAGLGTMWGEQTARQMLHEAGFSQIDVKRIEDDILNSYYIATKT